MYDITELDIIEALPLISNNILVLINWITQPAREEIVQEIVLKR
jgi:hypothetical protein